MAEESSSAAKSLVDRVRAFNRFYTREIGTLEEGLLRTQYSLTEGRVLYELAHRDRPLASTLAKDLRLDPGYLSRLLQGFEKKKLIVRKAGDSDARQSVITLTKAGQREAAQLDRASSHEVAAQLATLSDEQQRQLVSAMQCIQALLCKDSNSEAPYILRPHRPGDMGWVVNRQALLYAREYGWDERFEALVARIVADFVDHYDPRRERCWIAERRGDSVGSIFLIKNPDNPEEVAQLRLLFVEASARGLGIGRHLVHECSQFAQSVGYKRIMLWTNKGLDAARHLYEQEGYKLKREEPHRSFGKSLVGQFWELDL